MGRTHGETRARRGRLVRRAMVGATGAAMVIATFGATPAAASVAESAPPVTTVAEPGAAATCTVPDQAAPDQAAPDQAAPEQAAPGVVSGAPVPEPATGPGTEALAPDDRRSGPQPPPAVAEPLDPDRTVPAEAPIPLIVDLLATGTPVMETDVAPCTGPAPARTAPAPTVVPPAPMVVPPAPTAAPEGADTPVAVSLAPPAPPVPDVVTPEPAEAEMSPAPAPTAVLAPAPEAAAPPSVLALSVACAPHELAVDLDADEVDDGCYDPSTVPWFDGRYPGRERPATTSGDDALLEIVHAAPATSAAPAPDAVVPAATASTTVVLATTGAAVAPLGTVGVALLLLGAGVTRAGRRVTITRRAR